MSTHARTVSLCRAGLSLGILTLTAMAMLAVAIATVFQCRRFYSERIATPCGYLILRVWGIRMIVRSSSPLPAGQCVFISNHTSTIDLFALVALGLPNARFFLSGFLRKLLPLGLIGYLIGIFWTVPQEYPERRRRIFQRAERVLRRTGESVYLSPEGMRVTGGEIGHFNKGAFHLATALGAPIVPLFIHIPKSIDPGLGWNARSGAVEVHVRPAIETAQWRLDDLIANKERVRDLYVHWKRELDAG